MRIVADANIPYVKEYFSDQGELILQPGRTITASDVQFADVLLVRSITHVGKALLQNSKVRFVGSITSGSDHLETTWLDEAHIPWYVAAGFNAPPVADYVVATIAALQRKNILPFKARAAIIGVGNVGALVKARLESLGFELLLCDPIKAQTEPWMMVSLEEIEDVDLISLHVPLTKHGDYPTYHFINDAFLKRQKKGCVLLNASRGPVIQFSELWQTAERLHWCFDVWEHEPKINMEILKQSLLASPHIAGYSIQSKIRGGANGI